MTPAPLPFDPIREARRQWQAEGWSDAAEGMVAVTSLMRAHQLVLGRVDAVLRPFGLTFARYEVLMILHFSRRGALPMTRMGARLQVHPTSVTNAVDRLEAVGMVARRPHPTDRRTTLVELTEPGRSVALDATKALNVEVFARPGLADGDVTDLVRVLTELRRNAGDFLADDRRLPDREDGADGADRTD